MFAVSLSHHINVFSLPFSKNQFLIKEEYIFFKLVFLKFCKKARWSFLLTGTSCLDLPEQIQLFENCLFGDTLFL